MSFSLTLTIKPSNIKGNKNHVPSRLHTTNTVWNCQPFRRDPQLPPRGDRQEQWRAYDCRLGHWTDLTFALVVVVAIEQHLHFTTLVMSLKYFPRSLSLYILISENVDFLPIQSCGKIYSLFLELGLGLQLDLPKESTGNNSLHTLCGVKPRKLKGNSREQTIQTRPT